ncbi:MAG: ATP-dependent sacrificial sulfur transferase LarE [Parasporobacterium sp.]|nr:ATP-dependent sacrificial sulfur transferase LarE [Parasporobacterium sp.]
MNTLSEKKQHLEQYLLSLGSVLVAFSSGVDSTFLLKTAHDILGDQCAAVTARSSIFPSRESKEAATFCRKEGIRQITLDVDELSIDGFSSNPPDRCYLCKRSIFRQFQETARQEGFSHVVEGSNVDDLGDYRPGLKAIAELQILSPLREAGLTKSEIRSLSKDLDLPTWNKPSFACLASRFVYGEEITEQKLSMVELAEQRLLDLGFRQFRVRIHDSLARIELEPAEIDRFMQGNIRSEVCAYLHELGFLYVTLDLDGYRTGSMNKVLTEKDLKQ